MGRDEVILLDTHAAIWFATDSELLRQDQSRSCEIKHCRTRRFGGQRDQLLGDCAAHLEAAIADWKDRPPSCGYGLIDAGVTELPVTGPISIQSVELNKLHGDRADRFIAATAVIHGATLMTADADLLRWRHPIQRQDASK